MNQPLQEDIDFLEHFGTKGMQWGVRRNRRAEQAVKVGSGKGSTIDKLNVYRKLGPVDFAAGKGLKGGAMRKGTRQLNRNAAVQAGKAHVGQKFKYYATTKQVDLVPVKSANKDVTNSKDRAKSRVAGTAAIVTVAVGGKFVRALLASKK